ncbi:MBL fold metallo-hydrolase [Paenibacillaceae bacterium]|nr:MBL fold metallo-hydrolase [Paenibacillaceae bacterium]
MRKPKFGNLNFVKTEKTLTHFKRWRQERARRLRTKDYSFVVPNVTPDLAYLSRNATEPSVTWIGHSTFLLQYAGLNIVTDPVWSQKMAFQNRLAPPGIALADMPPIDIVMVSHSHYDHLNIASLRRLTGTKLLLVPAGLKAKLRLKGFTRIQEFHWWESTTIKGVKFTFVPSQHWSRRTPWDMNRSHWGGWVIEPEQIAIDNEEAAFNAVRQARQMSQALTEDADTAAAVIEASRAALVDENAARRMRQAIWGDGADYDLVNQQLPVVAKLPTVYFAGDSGYFHGFKEIGERFDIDLAVLPIGAYDPEWFMGPQHVTPEQALQAFIDTGAKYFLPMHYGSFKLADDTPLEALDRLQQGRSSFQIAKERIVVLPHGETWRLSGQ